MIECTGCGASSHVEFGFKENLVSVWNARASDAAIRAAHAEIERLRQEAIDLTEAIIDWYTKPSRKTCDILEEFARAALQETDK